MNTFLVMLLAGGDIERIKNVPGQAQDARRNMGEWLRLRVQSREAKGTTPRPTQVLYLFLHGFDEVEWKKQKRQVGPPCCPKMRVHV